MGGTPVINKSQLAPVATSTRSTTRVTGRWLPRKRLKCWEVPTMMSQIFLIFIAIFLQYQTLPVNCQLLQPDNRCFLEDGGSTLTFFIKEDLTVGQQIGRLNIKGTVGRDIDLSLKDINQLYDQLPVELEGKNLIIIEVSSFFYMCN